MIELVIDFASLQSYLALRPSKRMADDLGIELKLTPLRTIPVNRPPSDTEEEESIAVRHQRVKNQYSRMDAERYAAVQQLPLKRMQADSDSNLALLGLLAANEANKGYDYADQVFTKYWSEELDFESEVEIEGILKSVGVSHFDTSKYEDELSQIREICNQRQIFQTPMYWVEGERYQSRAHLPLIKRQLTSSLP